MPDFWPYLIFRLYLSRMQKNAFFPVCANIPGKSFSRPLFLAFRPRGRVGFLADEART